MPNIKISIDVTKIDKDGLYAGKKGKYLNLVVWENRDGEDQYGNHYRVDQDLPKEMRDAGKKGVILGNGKNFGSAPAQRTAPAKRPPVDPDLDAAEDDIPFKDEAHVPR